MAECIGNGDNLLQVFPPINDKICEYTCKNCSAYKSQLNKVLEELEPARAIIDILHKELPTIVTTETTCNDQTTAKEWTTISSKNSLSKPKKKKKKK